MDPRGNIYRLNAEKIDAGKLDEIREDVARLDGYLRGRAESDASKRGAGSNQDLAG